MSANTAIPPVLSIDEAADYLRASREHVYNLLRRGELTSVRAGHRRLIRRVDIDTMLEKAAEDFKPRPRQQRPRPVAPSIDIFA
ncbi:helix-turn-helix domain-containing protein [Rhizobium sp. WYJ-E13]|uniref:helix-turn-helix domain-containing protein n=1 Tax=Rhizobium sp. WYJ-E13 TaxID=2849093 RepID=UPI001C1EA2C5|nr:helix-turn-helix domain-containing protein [Rhizobium sp. WYJ-E13]QWW67976.1 helix-turn-helix domain-containing protein [Rhizobium sp. WYJ-E13]